MPGFVQNAGPVRRFRSRYAERSSMSGRKHNMKVPQDKGGAPLFTTIGY